MYNKIFCNFILILFMLMLINCSKKQKIDKSIEPENIEIISEEINPSIESEIIEININEEKPNEKNINEFDFKEFIYYNPNEIYYIKYSGVYCYEKQRMHQNIHFLSTVYYNEVFNFEYDQYENILFFKSNSGNNIIYYPFYHYEICTNIENIDSIVFSDLNNITIKGSHKKEGKKSHFFGSVEDIEVKWVNTIREEIVMTYISNVTDEMIGKEIPKNKNEGRKESFFNPIARSKDEKYFLFNFFGRNVVFVFNEYIAEYIKINISAIYNKSLDKYFIFVDCVDNSLDH